ncbi:mCG141324 [Mus musculus]|nr:mCG141324 [Mus musculus]
MVLGEPQKGPDNTGNTHNLYSKILSSGTLGTCKYC